CKALLAERVKNEDSMDLFRHTTQLGIHPESCIGYSQFVCSTLLNTSNTTDPRFIYSIEKMYAIPVAVDAMTYYTELFILLIDGSYQHNSITSQIPYWILRIKPRFVTIPVLTTCWDCCWKDKDSTEERQKPSSQL
ncbi:unnamed protein product, partial [Timema podura]|nr:unnamed protein product [Timema podura]